MLANTAHWQELGEPVQLTYGLLARFVKRMVPILRDMAKVSFFDL